MSCESTPEKCAAAEQAVRKVFAILGVDVDDPKQVKDFQDSLRFGEKLRAMADKSMTAFVLAFVTASVAAFLYGIKSKLMGGG